MPPVRDVRPTGAAASIEVSIRDFVLYCPHGGSARVLTLARCEWGAAVGQTTQTMRVFLLDDHDVVREGLHWLLQALPGFEVVGEAATAARGFEGILRLRPDLAIVDASLPDGNGVTVIREIRSRLPSTRCVVFTSFAEDDALYSAVVAGAAAFLPKSAPRGQVVDALRRLAAGESLLGREDVEAFRRRREDLLGEDLLLRELTGQERRILEMMTEGATNREIACRLNVGEKTIRNYVSVILSKLGMRNRTEAAVYLTRQRSERRASRALHRAS